MTPEQTAQVQTALDRTATYILLRKEAEQATKRADEGNCIQRWYVAADKWERAMKYSDYTKFQIQLNEAAFVGEFKRWLSRHPAAREKRLQRLKEK